MASPRRLEVILNHLHGFSQILTERTSTNKYRYTLNNNVLTNEQRAFYEENGYLIIRNLIDHQILDECNNRFIDICNGKVEKGQMIIMKEKTLMDTDAKGEYLINKLQDILFDDIFERYITNPSLLRYIESFIGPNITAFHSILVNKPPTYGSQPAIHPMHQDLYYLPIRPADCIVASWTAMERVTVDNGCLYVVPGTHKMSLQPHDYPEDDVNYMYYMIKGYNSLPRLPLEMDKGDTVFFHPLLLHGSGPNLTKGFRRAMICHYASSDCYFIDETNIDDNVKKDAQKMMKPRGFTVSHRNALCPTVFSSEIFVWGPYISSIVPVQMNYSDTILNDLQGNAKFLPERTSNGKYLYTFDNNILTDEQRLFYDENGYLIIRKLVDHKLVDECRNRFVDICNGKNDTTEMNITKDISLMNIDAQGEYLIVMLENLISDDVFEKYAKDPAILKYVECFTGPNITAINSLLINKPPDSGRRTAIYPVHQNLYYFPIRPAVRIVGSWTAMEKVTEDNGCLFVFPGTHKTALQPHGYPENKLNELFYEITENDLPPRVHLEMEKGDTIFFHPLLFHGSGPNVTKACRKAITCHYASSDCHYIDKAEVNQENMFEDFEKIMKAKGCHLSYLDVYKLRMKIVKGKPGLLQNC